MRHLMALWLVAWASACDGPRVQVPPPSDGGALEELTFLFWNGLGPVTFAPLDAETPLDVASGDVVDPSHQSHLTIWWWESLSLPSERISYEPGKGREAIASVLRKEDDQIFLVITDEQAPPFIVIAGHCSGLLDLVDELRYCEYFLVPANMTWILFDTHHDVIVTAGLLP